MMKVYKEYLGHLPKVVDVATAGAINPIHVAKAVEDALRSANPKPDIWLDGRLGFFRPYSLSFPTRSGISLF